MRTYLADVDEEADRAPRLVGQLIHEQRGEREMLDGVRLVEAQREENRRKREALEPKVRHAPELRSRKGRKPDL